MNFDQNDPANLGRALYFDLAAHIAAVESLIRSDEIEMALKLCDMVPAWQRENYPRELQEIKQTIARQLYDQIEYANDDEEAGCEREFGEAQWGTAYVYPRGEIIEKIVREINEEMPYCYAPWIFDLGCSHGNLPLGLLKTGLRIKYKGVGLNWRIVQKVKEWCGSVWRDRPLTGQPTILFCSEVLEHASRVEDIVITANKECVNWDVIVLSVPLGTLGGGLPNWRDRRLGHVRTFTPGELLAFASENWRGYSWELYKAHSMVLVGRKCQR